MNFDRLLTRLAARESKPDLSLGKSVPELAVKWKCSDRQAERRCRRLWKAGLVERTRHFRLVDGLKVWCNVYREVR